MVTIWWPLKRWLLNLYTASQLRSLMSNSMQDEANLGCILGNKLLTHGQLLMRCMNTLKHLSNMLQGAVLPVHATLCLAECCMYQKRYCKPRVRLSHCCLAVIDMHECASMGEMLFSTRLSMHPSHLSSSSFIRAKQQDGRVHLGLIVELPLLTNPAHCWRNKKEIARDQGKKWKF